MMESHSSGLSDALNGFVVSPNYCNFKRLNKFVSNSGSEVDGVVMDSIIESLNDSNQLSLYMDFIFEDYWRNVGVSPVKYLACVIPLFYPLYKHCEQGRARACLIDIKIDRCINDYVNRDWLMTPGIRRRPLA